jgi:glycosyltransferase involved in cell wall biosynthesis
MAQQFKKDKITYHAFHDIDRSKFYRHERRSIREAVIFALGMFRVFGYKFDVIQSNQFPIIQLPVLKLYCILSGCKLIVDVHEVWDHAYWTTYLGGAKGYLANAFSSWALKMGDHYIANSSITERNLVGLGIKVEKITVFAPTIDHEKLSRIKAAEAKKEMIFAGRLIKEKRIDKWLGVLAKTMKIAKVKGVIIGDGPDKAKIEALVRKMGLESSVEVRDFYSGSNKPALFKRIKEAGLFLHMSEREGLSTVALESIALGTPVLLPSYTPIPKDVKEMCVVAPESQLPKMAAEILKGPKEDYIMKRDRIERFYTSSIPSVYGEIFRKLGI